MARDIEERVAALLRHHAEVVLTDNQAPSDRAGRHLAGYLIEDGDLRALLERFGAPLPLGACNSDFDGRQARLLVFDEPTAERLTVVLRRAER